MLLACIGLAALLLSCTDPAQNKPYGWFNGTPFSSRAYDYFNQGDLTRSLMMYKRALVAADKADVQQQAGRYLLNIGRVFTELNMVDSALLSLHGAYFKLMMFGDSASARRSAGFIALIWCSSNELDSAQLWYDRGVAGVVKSNDNQAFWLSVSAAIQWKKNHEKSALAYYEKSFELYKGLKQLHAMAQVRLNQASIYYYFGEYDEAQQLLEEALSYSDYSVVRYDHYKMLLALAMVQQCRNNSTAAAITYKRALHCAPTGITLQSFENAIVCSKELPAIF